MTNNPTRQPWPDLPESMVDWPSVAVEFLICLNRIRRASGQADTHENAARTLRHARAWWSVSTAHEWPTSGKRSKALEAGIEPALLTLRRIEARLRTTEAAPSISAPATVSPEDLQAALKALGLDSLPVVSESGERAA